MSEDLDLMCSNIAKLEYFICTLTVNEPIDAFIFVITLDL